MKKKTFSTLAISLLSLVALSIEYVITANKADALQLTFAQDTANNPSTPANSGALPTATTAIALRNTLQASTTAQKPFTTIDFQSGVVGPTSGVYTFGNGTITAPAAALTGGTPANGISGISGAAAFGFNTTGTMYGGAGNLLRLAGGSSPVTLTIAFITPIIDFGFFVTDYGNGNAGNNINVQFFNGVTPLFTFNDIGTNPIPVGNNNIRIARFNKFVAHPGDSRITSVQITAVVGVVGPDRFGIDDIVYSVPFDFEPSLGIGLLGLGFGLNKVRKNWKAKKNTEV